MDVGVKEREKQKERIGDRKSETERKKVKKGVERVGGEKGGLVCVIEAKKKKHQ